MLQELKARPLVLILGGLLLGIGFPTVSWLFGIVAAFFFVLKRSSIGLLCLGVFSAGFLLQWHAPLEIVPSGTFQGRIVLRSFPKFLKGDRLYSFETIGDPKQSVNWSKFAMENRHQKFKAMTVHIKFMELAVTWVSQEKPCTVVLQ